MVSSPKLVLALIAAVVIVPMTQSIASADPSATAKKSHQKMAAVTTWPQVCPVTGDKIDSIKDAVGSSVYKGKTYYFCCSMCKPSFDKDPAKYAAAAAKSKNSTSM